MFSKTKLAAALLLAAVFSPASAIVMKVNSYTSQSVTFTLTGQMPTTAPSDLRDGPNEIDLNYTGNLWIGGKNYGANQLDASPFVGSGALADGNTGGFSGVASNYSWLYFQNDLTGLQGTGAQVTLTWGGADLLNNVGTGSIDLYWSNLSEGPDPTGNKNVLLSSVSIVDGKIVGEPVNDVPEPGTLALMGVSAVAFAARRRKK